MPTYDYECRACGHRFEKFQSITARLLRKCPQCGRLRLRRLIGAGAGILFRGSGFYQTDYRSESYRKAAEKEKSATSKESDSGDKPSGSKKSQSPESKAEPGSGKAEKGD